MPVISGFKVSPSVGPQAEKSDICPACWFTHQNVSTRIFSSWGGKLQNVSKS